VFGNAIGNSIVSNRINAEQTKRNAMLASDALSQQTNGRLNQQLDAELQQKAGAIANDVGTRSAADGAVGFDANVLVQLNSTDLMMDQYLNKRAGAIDGYLNMSQKTQRDIQSINARTETSRQQRATQAAQIQQRYDQRTMDFRMANPVHRGHNSLLNQEQISTAKALIQQDGQQIAKNKAHLQASLQLDNEFAALKKLNPEINSLFSDKWLEGFIGGPLQPLPSDVTGYQSYSSGLTNLSASIGGLGISSNTLGALLESGWGSSPGIGKEWNMFWNDPKLTMHADWHFGAPALNAFGSKLSIGGIGLSILGATNETFGNPNQIDKVDYLREWGKVGLDAAAAATGFVTKFARFSLPGAVYSGLDITAQLTPGYTVQHGSEAGKLKNGWTKFMYVGADQAEQMRRINPEMHYQLYIKRDPKF